MRIFRAFMPRPPAPPPPPPPPPPIPTRQPAPPPAAAAAAEAAEPATPEEARTRSRTAAQTRRGFPQTITTSGLGVTTDPNVTRRTLLG